MAKHNLNIIYLGNNDPRVFKRGVENVIYSQSQSVPSAKKYYLFFGKENSVFRWDDIICISIKQNWSKVLKFNFILYKIKKQGKSIIHSHGPVRTLLSVFKTDILTVHDAIYYQRKGLRQKLYKMFYLVEKIAYLRCKKIHFISKYTKDQALLDRITEKKTILVYNTTPLEQTIISNSKQSQSAFSCNTDYYTLFAVRGIQERTRIDVLIDFADYCKDLKFNGKEIRIIIAGKGPLLEFYRKDIQNRGLKNISLIGFVDDEELSCLYKTSDCIILTCDHAEGFGLPIIEGYCCNKPVIGSNKCAVPEIIIDDIFLFENNSESIFETLSNINIDNYNFEDYYYKYFSSNIYHERFRRIYEKLI